MNIKKVYDSIQERIVLDNFKKDNKRRKNKKKAIIAISVGAIVTAGWFALTKKQKETI